MISAVSLGCRRFTYSCVCSCDFLNARPSASVRGAIGHLPAGDTFHAGLTDSPRRRAHSARRDGPVGAIHRRTITWTWPAVAPHGLESTLLPPAFVPRLRFRPCVVRRGRT